MAAGKTAVLDLWWQLWELRKCYREELRARGETGLLLLSECRTLMLKTLRPLLAKGSLPPAPRTARYSREAQCGQMDGHLSDVWDACDEVMKKEIVTKEVIRRFQALLSSVLEASMSSVAAGAASAGDAGGGELSAGAGRADAGAAIGAPAPDDRARVGVRRAAFHRALHVSRAAGRAGRGADVDGRSLRAPGQGDRALRGGAASVEWWRRRRVSLKRARRGAARRVGRGRCDDHARVRR
ncbi:Cytidine and dCMP deaminase domain-containing protein 1 [Frankliniella fusca]|uniref:Cytidine and dCMP deaminase domain-containing protein 1 n=1 Tax=Frankliniella fusca TaxID=407009 RepID=A0AAE1LL95_9NEOP|nr:Cytidine and dCMP deaminase domain-containing protein 1 [Frankliniella fusca]